MDVEEAIRYRKSVRSYRDRNIPREKIEKVMDSVRMAPSAGNRQDWRFVIVTDEGKMEEVYGAANRQDFVKEASAVIAGVTTDPEDEMSCGISAGIVDLSIAMDHLTLKATEEGLGTCWLGDFDQSEAKNTLGIPEEYEIVALIPIGYPEEPLRGESKSRKALTDIISYNNFSE